MAMIDRIRKRRKLLLIVIGIGMLGFLIPYDAVMALFGSGTNATVATIAGEDIRVDEYQKMLRDRREILSYQNDEGLNTAVWNDLIEGILLRDEYNSLGMAIGKEEYDEMRFGQNISSFAKSIFYGGTVTDEGRQNVRERFSAWFNGNAQDRKVWEDYKNVLTTRRLREKYDALTKAGVYVNTLEARFEDKTKNEKVTVNFVLKKFTDIADTLIDFSERDVKAYFEKHKHEKKYAQKTGRSIKYVTYSVAPSAEDSAATRAMLSDMKASFAAATSDSLFVLQNSAVPSFAIREYRDGAYPGPENSEIMAAAPGTVIGPIVEVPNMKILKVTGRKQVPEVNARHILIKGDAEGNMDAARAKADSLKKVIKRDKNFADLAKQFSEDPGSGAKGGDLGWFGKGMMVAPFEDACFNGKVGDMPVVESQFGIHLIEIMEKKDVSITLLAEVQKTIEPSSETLRRAYQNANDFAIANSTEEAFLLAADSLGVKEANAIAPNATTIAGLSDPFQVINWVYKAEIGEVSSPLPSGNLYVVALLTGATEEGLPTFDAVKDLMEAEVIKEKKGEMYMKIMSEGKNLEEVAAAAGSKVQNAPNISLSSLALPGAGNNEPKVIGSVFYLKENEMSLPIVGEMGVYVVAPAGAPSGFTAKEDYSSDKSSAITRVKARVNGGLGVYNAMKEDAKIKDDRRKF